MKMYIYNTATKEVIQIITGDDNKIIDYVTFNIDSDTHGATETPAFNCVDGLIMVNDVQVIEL